MFCVKSAGAVGSGLADGAALMDGAVQVDYVMVTYLREALLAVPAVQVFYCVMAALWCGAAMDYTKQNRPLLY